VENELSGSFPVIFISNFPYNTYCGISPMTTIH